MPSVWDGATERQLLALVWGPLLFLLHRDTGILLSWLCLSLGCPLPSVRCAQSAGCCCAKQHKRDRNHTLCPGNCPDVYTTHGLTETQGQGPPPLFASEFGPRASGSSLPPPPGLPDSPRLRVVVSPFAVPRRSATGAVLAPAPAHGRDAISRAFTANL